MLTNLLKRFRSAAVPEPLQSFETPPVALVYKMPAGEPWAPMWDSYGGAFGQGWRGFEAIQLWRDSWPKPTATLTAVLDDQRALNVYGLWWRPVRFTVPTDAPADRKPN